MLNHFVERNKFFLVVLTFELIEDTDGLNDITRVGKNLNDVILHGAHHAEPRLVTYIDKMSSLRINTLAAYILIQYLQLMKDFLLAGKIKNNYITMYSTKRH